MWKTATYKLNSLAPLIMHNGQLADPLNKWVQLIKPISAKRNKTEADQLEIAHLEFLGGLYMDENGPIIPSYVIDATFINGGKKTKEGFLAKSGLFCIEHASLEYDGPRTASELWEDERFRYYVMVVIGNKRIPRMRPIFHEWTTTVKINYEDTITNQNRVDEWIRNAGLQVGVCERRPQYGRFEAERF